MNLFRNNKVVLIFLLFFLVLFLSAFSYEYIKIDPGSCEIISYLEGNYGNIKHLSNNYVLKVEGDLIVEEIPFYSLDEELVVPFQKNLEISVFSLDSNNMICSKKYENLVFRRETIDEFNIRNKMIILERKQKESNWAIAFIILAVLLIFLIFKSYYLLKLRNIKKKGLKNGKK
ncbi:MAG: hypothetical protein QW210_03535 [Candidatus Woesearchaeota archaeon]